MKNFWALLALATLCFGAQAQWTEVGDAGDLPRTAQATGTNTTTPLPSISGTIGTDDVDMFAIYIADPSTFRAETNTTTTDFDSQLWLFDVYGNGIVHDDNSAGSLRSRITNANNCILRPGTYYIAISRYNRDPYDCDGNQIWTGTANVCAVAGRSLVASWRGTTSAGNYQIVLTGAFTSPLGAYTANCPPTAFLLRDGDTMFFLRYIRGQRFTSAGGWGDYHSLSRGADHLYQNWWWFRTDSDTREFALSNLTLFEQPTANTAILTYNEGILNIVLRYTLADTGNNQARLRVNATLTNNGSAPVTVNLFNYSDYDIDSLEQTEQAELVAPGHIRTFRETGNTGHVYAIDTPSAWQIDTYPSILNLLIDRFVTNLNNSGSPYGPADATSAFQWQIVLNPGDSRTIRLLLNLNLDPTICEADVNDDSVVDDADLLLVLFAFGQGGASPADINGDNIVDDADLLLVLFNFGCGS